MPQPVVHFEIGCKDKGKTTEFYGTLFDWKAEDFGEATMINTGSEEGIQGHISTLGHEPHNYTIFYVQVDDLEAYGKRCEELGGKVIIPPVEIPKMGSFSWIADPEGNTVGLWKPMT